MPSPLAHLTTAVLVERFSQGTRENRTTLWKRIAYFAFYACAPDLDAVVGIVLGDLQGWHNRFTHSFAFGLLFCSMTFAPAARGFLGKPKWIDFALSLVCYSLHIMMDWMTYGRGVMLAWPFSANRFKAPFVVFSGLRWSEGFSVRSLGDTLVNELVFMFFVIGIIITFQLRRRCVARS